MNIFNKYGIKEVADVTFYSITRVGDEEFYTPVLFFDTLKVSTVDKTVNTVSANGGKGNGKVLSWNFGKDITLKLEDALFSDASMDMFMNGRIQAKLSNWTSAIAKLNIANRYGKLNYSVKAYPSPQLTESEWEIVFRCAQKAGFSAKYGDAAISEENTSSYTYLFSDESSSDAYVAENRKFLTEKYMKRTQSSPKSRDISFYYDINEGFTGIDIQIDDNDKVYIDSDTNVMTEQAAAEFIKERIEAVKITRISEIYYIYRNISISYVRDGERHINQNQQLKAWISITKDGFYCHATQIIGPIASQILENVYCGYDVFNDHIFYYLFPHHLDKIIDLCYCDMQDKIYKAMPQIVIKEIIKEIDTIRKVGFIRNDLYDSKYIDRFEACVVTNRKGLVIDADLQRKNLARYYNNDLSESFTIYYDAKTMLPLFQSKDFGIKTNSKQYISDLEINLTDETELRSLLDLIEEKSACSDDFKYQVMNYIMTGGLEISINFPNSLKNLKSLIEAKIDEEIDHVEDILFIGGLNEYGIPNGIEVTNDGYKILNIKIKAGYALIKYVKKNPNLFRIKRGTRYLKLTRTINEPGSIYTTIGTDLIIDADTFPEEYKIVGETYIREQKTGKDERYQFVLNRAVISPATTIKLEAGGDPTTFSIDVDVLKPKNKDTMELRQFKVEEDKREGGFRIVPQDKRYSYTPTNQEYADKVIDNNEIY